MSKIDIKHCKVIFLKDCFCGLVPITYYKKDQIVSVNKQYYEDGSNGYFDAKTGSKLDIEKFQLYDEWLTNNRDKKLEKLLCQRK